LLVTCDGIAQWLGRVRASIQLWVRIQVTVEKIAHVYILAKKIVRWVLGLRHMVAVSYSSALPYVRAECRIHSKLKGSIIGDIIRDF